MNTSPTPTDQSAPALHPVHIDLLRATLHGDLITPDDDAYDEARAVWNGMIDRRPRLITRCADNDDVIACVQFARAHGLPLAVRGGGHNVAGSALRDDALVIDLSPMRGIQVDLEARRVHAQGGVTIGELDRATQPYGLAAPMGVVTETGIAGLTLGGGLGWMRRKHGLSCDALRSADVVTADGRLLYVSEAEHPDLFWALRGGGGNFGIVTRFEYELYEVGPDVFFLATFYPADQATDVLRQMRAYMATAPTAFSPIAALAHVPPVPMIPEAHHGEPCVVLVGPYAGDVADGERALALLRTLGTPLADLSGTVPYLEVQRFFDEDYPSGGRYYWKSINLTALGDDAIERLIALNDEAPSRHSTLDIWFQGGAMSRVGADATGFGDRDAPILIGIEANWHEADDDDTNVAWARRCFDAMQPYSNGRMYLNFPGVEGASPQQLQQTYGAGYERLAAIKCAYDPDNVFRTHQTIQPAPTAPDAS